MIQFVFKLKFLFVQLIKNLFEKLEMFRFGVIIKRKKEKKFMRLEGTSDWC